MDTARLGGHRRRVAWLAALALLFWAGPGRADLPAGVAADIERIATLYKERQAMGEERRRRGMNPRLAATIERTDRQVAEASLAAEISRAITRDPRLTEELVSAAFAAAPDLGPGIARRLVLAFPGFRKRIEAAARNPAAAAVRSARPAPRAAPRVQAPPAPPRRPRASPRGPAPLPALPLPSIEAEPIAVPATAAPRRAPPVRQAAATAPAAPTASRRASLSELDEADSLDTAALAATQAAASRQISGAPVAPDMRPDQNDPLEGFNRVMFTVNDTLDQYLMRPIAWVYRKVFPEVAREAVRNGFRNVSSPVIFANDLLQGEFHDAGVTLARFLINSTAGIAGLIDVAAETGLVYHPADLGETFNSYEIGAGPYLVLPFLGPGTTRQSVGKVLDGFFDPLNYYLDTTGLIGMEAGRALVKRDEVFDEIDSLRRISLDYYAAIRSLYYQDRAEMLAHRSEPAASPAPAQ